MTIINGTKKKIEDVLGAIVSAKREFAISGTLGGARSVGDSDLIRGYRALSEEIVGDSWHGLSSGHSSFEKKKLERAAAPQGS